MRTANKNEVRSRLYDDVRALLPKATSFGILAGPTPRTEIDDIRLRFYRPQIVAFDIDAAAVEAARECSVEAVLGNAGRAKSFEGRSIDFFNLDLFRTLTTEQPVIENAAKHARLGLAVFVSYDGRAKEVVTARETTTKDERVNIEETTIAVERVKSAETTKLEERVSREETTKPAERVIREETTKIVERVISKETTNALERLTVEQSTRIIALDRIIRVVRPEAKLARAYAYRGRGQSGVPMVGALFIFTKRALQTLPPFLPAYEDHTTEREFRLRSIGISGAQLNKKLKNGKNAAKRKIVSARQPSRKSVSGQTRQPSHTNVSISKRQPML